MCDGFSEAFMAAGISASEVGVADAAVVGGSTSMAEAGAYAGMAASAAGSTSGMLALGSAAMSGYQSYQTANAQRQAASYQSQVDANNAKIATEQRSATIQQGQAQAEQSQLQEAQVLGEQKAALGANGVNMGSGSAVDLMATTKFLNAQDVNAIQSNAARTAWGYGVDASNSVAASGLASWQAKNNNPAGIGAMGGASSLLTSATMYAMGNKANLFNSFTK